MMTNHNGEPVEETQLFTVWGDTATEAETHKAIGLLAELLGVEFYRTNATKHGTVEIVVRNLESNQ